MATLDIFQVVVRKADGAHETFIDHLAHRAPRFRERYAGAVRPVEEVDVDPIAAEPFNARSAASVHFLASKASPVWRRRELGRDEQSIADVLQHLADEGLVAVVVVDLGGVEPVDAARQRRFDGGRCLGKRWLALRRVATAKLETAETDGRDAKVRSS